MLKRNKTYLKELISEWPKTFLILKFISIYGSLRAIYHFVLEPNHNLMNNYLGIQTDFIAKIGHDYLDIPIRSIYLEKGIGLWYGDFLMLVVDSTCSAGVIYVLFISLMLLFGKLKKKSIIYLLLGIAGIFALNTIRIATVTYILKYHTVYFDLVHNYIFVYIIYLFVFYVWYSWYRKYYKNL